MNNWKTTLFKIQTFLKETFEEKMPVDVTTQSLSVAKHNAYFHEHALAELLPYEAFDETTQLFHNRDTLGFLVEASPLVGVNEEVIETWSAFLKEKLPMGATLQVLLIASPDIEGVLTTFLNKRSKRGGVFKMLAQKRCEFLKQGTTQSLLKSEDFLIRDFKCIFSVSMDKVLGEEVALKLKKEMLLLLNALKIAHQCLAPQGLMRLVHLLINPYGFSKNLAPLPSYQPNELLSIQVAPKDTSVALTSKQLIVNEGECVVQTYRLTQYPQQWAGCLMNELIGDPLKNNLRVGNPFVLSLLIYAGNRESEKTRLQAMNVRSSQKAASSLSNLLPNLKALDSDLKYAVKQLDEGDTLLKVCFGALVYGTQDTIQTGATQLETLLTAKKFKYAQNRYLQLPAFLSVLPMSVQTSWVDDMKRFGWFKTMLASTTTHFLPIQAENKGMGAL